MERQIKKVVSLVKRFAPVARILSFKAYLKGAFGFIVFLDLAFFFIEDI